MKRGKRDAERHLTAASSRCTEMKCCRLDKMRGKVALKNSRSLMRYCLLKVDQRNTIHGNASEGDSGRYFKAADRYGDTAYCGSVCVLRACSERARTRARARDRSASGRSVRHTKCCSIFSRFVVGDQNSERRTVLPEAAAVNKDDTFYL